MVRKAEEKDIKDIVRLLEQVARIHHSIRPDLFVDNAIKYDEQQLKKLLMNEAYHIALYEDETVKGYIICEVLETDSHLLVKHKTLYIDDLCVDEDARGQKIGKKLYDHAVSLAKDLDCYNVTLNVWEGNTAKDFYESLGLKVSKTGYELVL